MRRIERRTFVYGSVNLTGWRAVLAVFVAIAILYVAIVAFFAILSFIAFTVVLAMIGAGIYRLITGAWPLQFRDRQGMK
jgi:protein-S-isoprenylcysteine O-methyltransferase Ste14